MKVSMCVLKFVISYDEISSWNTRQISTTNTDVFFNSNNNNNNTTSIIYGEITSMNDSKNNY